MVTVVFFPEAAVEPASVEVKAVTAEVVKFSDVVVFAAVGLDDPMFILPVIEL